MKQTNRQIYWNWFLLSIFYGYQYLVRVYPNTFINEIRDSFCLSANEFATLSTYCLFIYSCLQIPFGALLDKICVRWLILVAFGLCLSGQYIFTHTSSPEWAQWGRILVGIGGAPAFMSAVKIASDSFSDKSCGLFIGLTCIIGTVFIIAGNSILKYICVQNNDWQLSASYLNVLGVILFVLCLLSLSTPQENATQKQEKNFWKNFLSVILNYRVFLYALLTIGTCAAVTTLADLWSTAFLMSKYNLSDTQAVFYGQFLFAGLLLGAFIIPLMFKGRTTLKGVRFCCIALAVLFGILIYGPNLMPAFVLQTILFALGFFACADVLCYALAAQESTPQTSGLIMGWVNTINMLGLTLLQMFFGLSLDEYWSGTVNAQGLRVYQPYDYELALGLLLNCVLVCLFIAFLMRTKNLRRKE